MNTLDCIALLSLLVLVLLLIIKKRENQNANAEGYIAPTGGYVGRLDLKENFALFAANLDLSPRHPIDDIDSVPELQQVAQVAARGGSVIGYIQSHDKKNPNINI